MKGKVRTALIVLAVLILAAVQAVVISQVVSADGPWSVLWKDECPAWGQVLTKTLKDGRTLVFCEVWDGGVADDRAP